ncbi:MAG: cation transporter [Porticoccaceae bacterium]|nr:MAG: cation transporter [Porticoccaceae bacterium]
MAGKTLADWQHEHDFTLVETHGERRTRLVLALTVAAMVLEIAAGTLFGSLALLADGWHMGTHAAAFLITLFAYRYARRHADNPRFSFGTGKVNALGGFASAVALAVVALFMVAEAVARLVDPRPIRFDEALAVAFLGLAVNVASALLLQGGHGRERLHHTLHGHDHNLRAAYFHVLADALTSVLAIVALTLGRWSGWHWLDPSMGLVGGAVIARWSWGLVRDTAPILIGADAAEDLRRAIAEAIEADGDNRIYDMHLWQVAPGRYAAIVALLTHHPRPVEHYRALLDHLPWLAHLTVEVSRCEEPSCEIHRR